RSCIHGQGADAGTALGGEERYDRGRASRSGLGLGRRRGGHLLLPELVQRDGDPVDVLAEAVQEPVPVEREQARVGDSLDARDVASSCARGGKNKEVAWSRASRQQQLARSVGDRLLGRSRGQEDD